MDLLSAVVFDFEVFEGDADLLVVAGDEVVDARGIVGVVARMARRVEQAVKRGAAAVEEVTSAAVARRRWSTRDRVVYTDDDQSTDGHRN